MEIQAKLSFKHGRIIRILNSNNLNVKQLAILCGWNYQVLLNYISFKTIPKFQNKESLFTVLKNFDPTITYEEIFPEEYKKVKEAFRTRISIKNIPTENLLSYHSDFLAIDYDTENQIAYKLDAKKIINVSNNVLSKKEMYVLKMYYGIDNKRSYDITEISQILNLSKKKVNIYRNRALRRLKAINKNIKKLELYNKMG